MNFSSISTYSFKFIGSLSLVHAVMGTILVLFSIFTFSDMGSTDFTQALNYPEIKNIELSDKERSELHSYLSDINESEDFKIFFWGMTSLGLITNILLFYFGFHLLKAKYKFAFAYIALMALIYLYMHEAPVVITEHENHILSFGAAWGIGNMGIAPVLYTQFWLWGPALALMGLFLKYISHNKELQRTSR